MLPKPSTRSWDLRNLPAPSPRTGWGRDAQKLESFTDVRDIQRRLKGQGVELESEVDEDTTGPASFVVVDPDGNPILVDQHV